MILKVLTPKPHFILCTREEWVMWERAIETITSFAHMYTLNVYVSFWWVENLEESGAYTVVSGIL